MPLRHPEALHRLLQTLPRRHRLSPHSRSSHAIALHCLQQKQPRLSHPHPTSHNPQKERLNYPSTNLQDHPLGQLDCSQNPTGATPPQTRHHRIHRHPPRKIPQPQPNPQPAPRTIALHPRKQAVVLHRRRPPPTPLNPP